MKNKIVSVILILILLSCSALFTFLFVNCIQLYSKFDVNYNELKYEELTFNKYEVDEATRGGDSYEIYFKEYEKSFEVSRITQKELNKTLLKELEPNKIIGVYYRENSSKKYDYSICEMKVDATFLLTLADYKEVNQNNQIIGMILYPIMIIVVLFLLVMFISQLYKNRNYAGQLSYRNGSYFEKTKADEKEISLGQIKIEYKENGNVIRVYNSPNVCSLVINNKVVDQYLGLVATRFCLKHEMDRDGEKILVEAKMGFFNMRLYYQGKLVGKKFMGLG